MMFGDKHRMPRFAALLLLSAAALALAGCESARGLNPFAEKDKILQGERRPVFEQGSGFEGPRKLPPPNSDYLGSTIDANQPPPPPVTTAPAPGTEPPPASTAR
jgi:hypothetical protein